MVILLTKPRLCSPTFWPSISYPEAFRQRVGASRDSGMNKLYNFFLLAVCLTNRLHVAVQHSVQHWNLFVLYNKETNNTKIENESSGSFPHFDKLVKIAF